MIETEEMPETRSVLLPVNLVEDTRYRNKSIYISDFCTRNRRIPNRQRIKTNETSRYARDIFNPSSQFLNDHYQTSSHLDLKNHCEKLLNSIERSTKSHKDYTSSKIKGLPRAGLSPTPILHEKDEPIINVLQPTIQKIERAWQAEVNTTKRERGDVYGKAGKKKWYDQSQKSAQKEQIGRSLIPGVGKWLDEANEFEKQIVYNFMTNVSDALEKDSSCSKTKEFHHHFPSDDHLQLQYSDNPKIEDYINSYPDTIADEAELTQHQEIARTGTPSLNSDDEYISLDEPVNKDLLGKHHVSFKEQDNDRYFVSRTTSPSRNEKKFTTKKYAFQRRVEKPNEHRQCAELNEIQETELDSTETVMKERIEVMKGFQPTINAQQYDRDSEKQQSYQIGIFRPRSAQGDHEFKKARRLPQRAMSADSTRKKTSHSHFHRHSHDGEKCTHCHDLEITDMAKRLSAMKPISYSNLRRERHSKPKMAAANMYHASMDDYATANDDYMHKDSVFKNVCKKSPGYFIIHPEWISERAVPKKSYR